MSVGLVKMMSNTEDLITSKVAGVNVRIRMHGIVGAKVGHFEVTAKLDNPGLTCPDEIVLRYSGDLTLGQLAMSASDFLEDVVNAQVYPLEDGMVDDE